jgi:hypothetical protein
MAPAHEDRSVAVRLAAAVSLLLLLVGQAQVTVLDGSSMLAVAQSIVHHGSLAVPQPLGVVGDSGLYYSKYGLLLPLLSVIPVALVQPLGIFTGRLDLLEAAAAASLMPLITGALAAALYLLGRRLGAPRAAALLVGAGIVLGTYLLPYGRDFFTEPLVALLLVTMVERALAGRELQAGTALALAVLARPQSAAFVPLLFAFFALRAGGVRAALRAILPTTAPLAVAAAITIAYNLVRFGDALSFGYEPPVDPGFTTPLLEGTRGLLLSPEKSIVLFAPAVVLVPVALVALWRRERWVAALLTALFAVSFVLAATWHSWMGGFSWGPRLVIPGVAVLLVALGPWIGERAARMRLAGALFALGFALSLAAVIAPAGAQLLDARSGTDGPQIVRQVALLPRLAGESFGATSKSATRDDYRHHLALWQSGIVRQAGGLGVLIAVIGSIALLAALLWVTGPLLGRTPAFATGRYLSRSGGDFR